MVLFDSIFRAQQGSAVLIGGGTLIPLDDQPIEIGIPVIGTDENLMLRLVLGKDTADKTSRWSVKTFAENPKLIELTIFNLESPLGGGPAQPISLWRNTDSSILLALRIYTQVNSTPTIHFSFYEKKHEVKL